MNRDLDSIGKTYHNIFPARSAETPEALKVHKNENFFDSDFGICVISLLVMHK